MARFNHKQGVLITQKTHGPRRSQPVVVVSPQMSLARAIAAGRSLKTISGHGPCVKCLQSKNGCNGCSGLALTATGQPLPTGPGAFKHDEEILIAKINFSIGEQSDFVDAPKPALPPGPSPYGRFSSGVNVHRMQQEDGGQGGGEGVDVPENLPSPIPAPKNDEYQHLYFPKTGKATYKDVYFGHYKKCENAHPYVNLQGRDFLSVMKTLHAKSYKTAVQARNTLEWISNISHVESQIAFWNWGKPDSPWKFLWEKRGKYPDGAETARRAGLWFWFGPYDHGRLLLLRNYYRSLVKLYEQDVVVLVYRCKSFQEKGAIAQHIDGYFITELMPSFWDGVNVGYGLDMPMESWSNIRTAVVFHEWQHEFLEDIQSGFCTDNKFYNGKCYQNNWEENKKLSYSGSNPRFLAIYSPEDAYKNNDNHLSWAFSRSTDPQWGAYNGPQWLDGTRVGRNVKIYR